LVEVPNAALSAAPALDADQGLVPAASPGKQIMARLFIELEDVLLFV